MAHNTHFTGVVEAGRYSASQIEGTWRWLRVVEQRHRPNLCSLCDPERLPSLCKHKLSFPGDYSSPSPSQDPGAGRKRSAEALLRVNLCCINNWRLCQAGCLGWGEWGGQAGSTGAGERARPAWSASSLSSAQTLCASWSRGPWWWLWASSGAVEPWGVSVCSWICKSGEMGRDLAWNWALSLSYVCGKHEKKKISSLVWRCLGRKSDWWYLTVTEAATRFL